MTVRRRIISATPLICLVVYLICGFYFNNWSPSWVVFFLIPIMPIILSDNWVRNLFPLVIIAAYISVSIVTGAWHPLWIMLLLIPIYYIIVGPRFGIKKRKPKIEFVER